MQDLLRKKVVQVFGEPVNSPKDCSELSGQVFAQSGRKVSPTTLRRFFGLLPSTSAFSTYVLDSISMYCGSSDYAEFCKLQLSNEGTEDVELDEIINEINLHTDYSLHSIYRRSLSDFKQTIPRREINRRLDAFMESDRTIFPVIAPGGYGKSTALAHWAETRLEKNICLFTSASLFVSLLDPGIQDMKSLHIRPESRNSIFNLLVSNHEFGNKKLLIILDALDEISSEADKLHSLVDFMFDVANRYSAPNKIKIVLSTRESVWAEHLAFRFEKVMDKNWFEPIDSLLESGYTNIFTLSNSEIREIIAKYNKPKTEPLIYECIPWNIRELIRIPINLHYVNVLYRKTASINHITRHAVIREFIRETIFNSRHAEQKEDLIWKVLTLIDAGEHRTRISKNELKVHYPVHLKREKAYYQAYADLLAYGVFLEYREENKYGIYVTYLGFKHMNFFYYLLVLFKIRENDGLDTNLLETIAAEGKEELWASNMIAILYQIAFENEDFSSLENFCNLPEALLGSLPVRLAVGNSFRENNSIRDKLIIKYASHEMGRTYFFERFVDINFLFNNFAFRIEEYLKHARNDEAVLFGNSILYLSGFLSMNMDKCDSYFSIIDGIEPHSKIHPWPIGRRLASQILQKQFIKNEEIDDLDKLIQNQTRIAYSYPGYLANGLVEFELYVMMALVLVQKFEVLDRLLANIFSYYNLAKTDYSFSALMGKNQNSLPIYFLEYAEYKQGRYNQPKLPGLWERAIDNFTATFDDYQYLILLNWFLCDYYFTGEEMEKSLECFNTALELSQYAGYEFYKAFLLKNNPMKNEEQIVEADRMIAESGFNSEGFTYSFGPSSSE